MTLNLTTLNSRTSITNNPPPAAPACGLNETGICCKESETAHPRPLRRSHHPKEDAPRPRLTTTRRGRREQPKLPAMGGISRFYLTRWAA